MEAIFSFFEGIGQVFQNLFKFIETFISGVIWLVQILPEFYVQVTTLVSYCPPFILVFLSVSWMLILLFAILKLF